MFPVVLDDHSRVVLHDCGPDFDYINASYISVVVFRFYNNLVIMLFNIFIFTYFIYAVSIIWYNYLANIVIFSYFLYSVNLHSDVMLSLSCMKFNCVAFNVYKLFISFNVFVSLRPRADCSRGPTVLTDQQKITL